MTVEIIYKSIAEIFIDNINDSNWAELFINFEAYPDSYVKYNAQYIANGSSNAIKLSPLGFSEVSDYIFDLQDIMGESNKWNKAVFTLQSTGVFDMKFDWDEELDKKRQSFQ